MTTMRELLPYIQSAAQGAGDWRPTNNERRMRTRQIQNDLLTHALKTELGEDLYRLLDIRVQNIGDLGKPVAEFRVDGVLFSITSTTSRWYTIRVDVGPFPVTLMQPRRSYTSYLRQDLLLYIERVNLFRHETRVRTS